MTQKKDELSTFRIADVKRPEVRSFQKTIPKDAEPAAAESPSVGFPALEARLEQGSIEDLATELRPSYEALEALASGGDVKVRAAAKKAMAAYERTADLFEYLYETKSAMTSSGGR